MKKLFSLVLAFAVLGASFGLHADNSWWLYPLTGATVAGLVSVVYEAVPYLCWLNKVSYEWSSHNTSREPLKQIQVEREAREKATNKAIRKKAPLIALGGEALGLVIYGGTLLR